MFCMTNKEYNIQTTVQLHLQVNTYHAKVRMNNTAHAKQLLISLTQDFTIEYVQTVINCTCLWQLKLE